MFNVIKLGEYFMKKMLFLLVLLTPFLTGCADVDTLLTINDDNSASVVSSDILG